MIVASMDGRERVSKDLYTLSGDDSLTVLYIKPRIALDFDQETKRNED